MAHCPHCKKEAAPFVLEVLPASAPPPAKVLRVISANCASCGAVMSVMFHPEVSAEDIRNWIPTPKTGE